MVEIVNISAGGDLHRELDLKTVRDAVDLAFVDYDDTANRVLLRYEEGGALLILFRTGKFILRGGDSYEGCYEARNTFYKILEDYGVVNSPEEIDFSIENVVCVGDLGREVDLSDLAVELGLDYTEYEPEQFPGLVYRPPDCDPTMNIYGTGKLTITGSQTVEEAEDAMSKLREKISSQ
jgi:transcription initiation factor TFIID TATA-box-binding protein